MMTFPQVHHRRRPVGGFQELAAADRAGRLADAARRRLTRRRRGRGWQPLAHVGPAPGGPSLRTGRRTRARLALAAVDEEPVLEGALHAVGMAEVVDRRALGRDPGLERRIDRVAERRELGAREPAAGASGWMRARNSASSA